jgi:CheY-like chemotaxis protein
MSHELRTPLNAILGFAQLMDRDPNLTVEQQENLTIINRSGEHLLALINDVLEMSKIEAGRVTLEEKSFDLYRMLDGLEEMFRLRAEDKGLALSFERSENVPRYVRTDEGKLRQVLSNLLGNAVKFTQEGGVTLRARSKEESCVSLLPASYTLLQFEVEDTGPGLAPEELAVVFDPFVQATSEQRSQEGTGLGLSISRQFVRLMGGDLSLSSEMGRGSLFKFDVQVGLVDAAAVQEAQRRRRVLGLAPDQPVYRLLVAEDKDTNRRLLVKLLESLGPSTGSGQGFEVREAINGQETIEMWEHWEPHLIWMDMRMPVVDGYQATKHIKTEIRNRKSGIQTIIIALTASAFEEDREKVLSQGCDDFVRKPFREDEIYEVLTEHLGVRFVYEEEATEKTPVQTREAAAPLGGVLTPEALTALPPDWMADLQEATIKADLSLILVLIDQISEENQALAQALGDLAHDYQYKRILTLIEKAGGQR